MVRREDERIAAEITDRKLYKQIKRHMQRIRLFLLPITRTDRHGCQYGRDIIHFRLLGI